MKKSKKRENAVLILLFIILIVLAVLQINISGNKNNDDQAVFSPNENEGGLTGENDIPAAAEIPFSEDEQPDIYDLTGYIYTNSQSYMERLKSEVNNMANATSDNSHLYDVAESIKLNEISYYAMLSQRYDGDNSELIEACKSYVFNVEALAANIMEYINESRTKYISRAMICISSDSTLSKRFAETVAAYNTAHPKAETEN